VIEEAARPSHATIVAACARHSSGRLVENVVALTRTATRSSSTGEAGEGPRAAERRCRGGLRGKGPFRARRQAQYRRVRERPAITRDGQRISLLMNAGLMVDLPAPAPSPARKGSGFRTEPSHESRRECRS